MKEKDYTVNKNGIKMIISATSRRTARKIFHDTVKRLKRKKK
jgi:hypothetical protein